MKGTSEIVGCKARERSPISTDVRSKGSFPVEWNLFCPSSTQSHSPCSHALSRPHHPTILRLQQQRQFRDSFTCQIDGIFENQIAIECSYNSCDSTEIAIDFSHNRSFEQRPLFVLNLTLQTKQIYTICMGKSTRRRAWSELPVHLLEDIADRLLIADYIRFGSVCKSWRMVFLENPYKKPLPPGLIARNKGSAQTCNFYSLVEKRVYDFPLWMPHELLHIRGSSFGWLITSLWKDGLMFVHLLNPFCSDNHRQIIHLPPLNFNAKHNTTALSSKIVLSANPTLAPNNYVVMARFSYRRFIYIKAGEKAWSSLVWKNSGGICDFTYSNKTKQFYAVDGTGAVVAIEIDANPDSVDQNVKMTQVAPSNHKHPGLDMYLVASSSAELLLVYRERFYSKMKSVFHVHKLDQITGGWIPILSLLDQMMFLGFYYSTCLSASEIPACKPNCIYFTDATGDEFGSSESHDMRVFSLEDGKTEVHYLFKHKKGDWIPVWLEPTIRGWT